MFNIIADIDVKSLYDTILQVETLTTREYRSKYVNLDVTQEACNECPNHNLNWACPDFTDDQLKTWDKYEHIDLFFVKIKFNKEAQNTKYTLDELGYIVENSLFHERNNLIGLLEKAEKEYDGRYLSAGYCGVCKKCSRIDNNPCRFPDKCHFSIESIGGLVADTLRDVFDEEIKWIDTENGLLPENLSLLMGLVY